MLHKQLLVSVVSSSSCLLLHSSYVFSGNLSLKKNLKIISIEMMKLKLRAQERSAEQCPPWAQCRQEDGGCSSSVGAEEGPPHPHLHSSAGPPHKAMISFLPYH